MIVTVLVPVSRFRLHYELGAGRPFGELDLLVIRAVGEGFDRIDQLTDCFQLPARLLLEIMVNLFHEGWLTFTLNGSLRLTEIGEMGRRKEIEPSSHRVIPRNMGLVLERSTGGIVNSQELVSQTQAKLERRGVWERAVRLPVQFQEDFIDPGQIKGLILRTASEWIRNIQTPQQTSKGWHWIETRVDLEKQSVVGVPESWKSRLRGEILAAASIADESCWLTPHDLRAFGSPPGATRKVAEASEPGYNLFLEADRDLILGVHLHQQRLLDVLATASTSVLLVSPTLNPDRTLLVAIEAAARRGVVVDLVWSRSPRAAGIIQYPALHELQTIADRLLADDPQPRLRVNDRPLPLGSCLLIWDRGDSWYGLMGTHSWLDQVENTNDTLSVSIGHPALIGEACLSVAATMATYRVHTLTGGVYRWRQLGTELDRKPFPQTAEPNCRVRLVHNQDLDPLLQDLSMTAQMDLAIASSVAAPDRWAAKIAQRSTPLASQPKWIAPAPATAAGIDIQVSSRCAAAGLVLADTTAVITTRRWFDSNPDGGGLRDMGILIDGGPLPEKLRKWFSNQWSIR